jgi:ATP-binding cassette subfamily C protein LapB
MRNNMPDLSEDNLEKLNVSDPYQARIDPLINCIQQFLKIDGTSISAQSIFDLSTASNNGFEAKHVVEVLTECGYRASLGKVSLGKITDNMCPMVIFDKNSDPRLLYGVSDERIYRVASPKDDFVEKYLNETDAQENFSGYAILARLEQTETAKSENKSWFFSALLRSKWLYFQVIIAAVMSNFLGLSSSLFIMVVYDRVVPNEAIESLIALTIGVSIALGFDFVIKTLRAHFIDKAGQRADSTIARKIFQSILQIKPKSKQQSSGAVASVVREFDTLRDFFTSATLVAIVDLPFVFFFVGVIYLIAGPLAYVPLAAVPLVFIVGLAIQPFLAKIASSSMKSGMSKQAILIETLGGIETIKATGSGRLMSKRFENAAVEQSDLGLKNRMFSQFAINFAASIQQFAQIATIFFGVFLIQDGTITMGAMIAAVILGGRTLAPLSQLASALTRANSARQAYKSLDALMKTTTTSTDTEHGLSRPSLSGAIEFKNVSYTFPETNSPILENLSFKIEAGQKVSLVGRMGSGKSTIARLASGLIAPDKGAILLDGVDVQQINKTDFLRNVGVMLQDSWLFSGTVKENLQMGFLEYKDDHILNIAKISGVDDFIGINQLGYDLQLSERGAGLSGGQKQSINLCRALLHSPSLLILDEPTSSMDTATEATVLTRLREYISDKTLLVITHRNSVLKLVDRILVIENGSIVTDASPEQIRQSQKKKQDETA